MSDNRDIKKECFSTIVQSEHYIELLEAGIVRMQPVVYI